MCPLPGGLQHPGPGSSRHRLPRTSADRARRRYAADHVHHSWRARGAAGNEHRARAAGQRCICRGGQGQTWPLRGARHPAAQRSGGIGNRARTRDEGSRASGRDGVQQHQPRGIGGRCVRAAVEEGGRTGCGHLYPSHRPARRRGDAGLLVDAARRFSDGHHARRLQTGFQRRRRAPPADPLGADAHGRRDPVPRRTARPRLPRVRRVPYRTSASRRRSISRSSTSTPSTSIPRR